ncbi:MAG: glutamate-5-semialdehyde dehydrogenase [Woeseia sp.]
MSTEIPEMALAATMDALGAAARKGGQRLAQASATARNKALVSAAGLVRERKSLIAAANEKDMDSARQRGLSGAMLDRLMLDDARIESMASGLESIATLPDPLGNVLAEWERPNGLRIQRVAVPLGVIGIIYESRPNVTADAAGLCLKSGNAVILRGGSESFASSRAIFACMTDGMAAAGLDSSALQMVPTTDRAAVGYLLSSMAQYVDVIVPRGGKSLISRVQQDARVPVIGHLEGLCHVYLHESADSAMAADIVLNAKMRRTGICGAAETVLIDRSAANRLLPKVMQLLVDAGCEVRGDADVCQLDNRAIPATEADWTTEYLDAIISIRIVDDIRAASAHIGEYGSGHTECIVAEDVEAVREFFASVDSAILLHNASTQFADGGEFGMGAEIGIATGRIHARGPVGAAQLTSYKYLVHGAGQLRP